MVYVDWAFLLEFQCLYEDFAYFSERERLPRNKENLWAYSGDASVRMLRREISDPVFMAVVAFILLTDLFSASSGAKRGRLQVKDRSFVSALQVSGVSWGFGCRT